MKKTIHSKEQIVLQKMLRSQRESQGLLQIDLARKLGCHQSFVSKYELGERRIDIIELRAVCRALNIDLISLIKDWENSNETGC